MKVAVCLKRIHAPDGNIRLSADGRCFDFSLVDGVLNPPDEYALEAALRVRPCDPSSRLLALSVGSRESEAVLRMALAVGADDAILVEAPGADVRQAAWWAAGALREFAPDLILCGRQAVDDQQGFFPAALAEGLGYAHLTNICSIEWSADARHVICGRRAESGRQEACVDLPAVLGCDRMAHELRTPSLKGRIDSKKRPLTYICPETLGGIGASRTVIERCRLGLPPERKPKRIWTAPADEAAGELLRELRNAEYLRP